jgi:ABC-type antimicrobial peptide transport system permease subunit
MKFLLTEENTLKILKGAMVAAGGAFLTFLVQASTGSMFGIFTPLVYIIASTMLNYLRKVVEQMNTK